MLKQLQDFNKIGEKDREYAKYHEYFETEDGLVIALDKGLPKPQRYLYYQDIDPSTGEYRTSSDIAPTKDILKELFVSENMRRLCIFYKLLERNPEMELYISKNSQYRSDKNGARYIRPLLPSDRLEISQMERKITEQELADIRAYEENRKAEFVKRLERYWNRYSDKVDIRTYWADR